MNIRPTRHATERVSERLNGLVSMTEVLQAAFNVELKTGENYVDVKHFPRRIYLGDPGNPETPKGDKITAKIIVERGDARIITVMLRKSTSKSARYDFQ